MLTWRWVADEWPGCLMLWMRRMFLLLYLHGLFWKSCLYFDRLVLYGGINIRDKEDWTDGGGSYANMMKKLESEAPMIVIYYYIILYRRIKFKGS